MFINHVINHVINHLQSLRFIGPPQWDDDEDPPSVAGWLGWFTLGFTKKKLKLRHFLTISELYIYVYMYIIVFSHEALSCCHVY